MFARQKSLANVVWLVLDGQRYGDSLDISSGKEIVQGLPFP